MIGGLLLALGQNNAALCLGRFAVGIGSGVGTVTLPLYIAEISPVSIRVALGSVNQVNKWLESGDSGWRAKNRFVR